MRTIKFRAWIGDRMEYSVVAGLGKGYFLNETAECVTKYDENPIMQFTGLTDKNGKEIYEGDVFGKIVKGNKKRFYGIVEWNDNAEEIYDDEQGGFIDCYVGFSFPNGWRKWEVIGNIYENPELLK